MWSPHGSPAGSGDHRNTTHKCYLRLGPCDNEIEHLGVGSGWADRTCLSDNQAVHGERCPEVTNLGVDDDGLGFALSGQDLAGHLLERDLLRPTDVLDATQCFAFCHTGDLGREFVGGDGLDQRVCTRTSSPTVIEAVILSVNSANWVARTIE
jgi:hypothetical protein